VSLLSNSINHAAIQYSETIESQVASICEPLRHLNITHFGYFKFFKDGTYLKICNNLAWSKFYITHNLADKTTAFAESIITIPIAELNTQLWPKSKGNECLSALFEHNVWNGIDLTIKHGDFIEVYYFGTEKDNNQIFDLYINHLDLLMKFKAYFQEKAAHLIAVKDKNALATQTNKISFFTEATQIIPLEHSTNIGQNININAFFNETPISHYYLGGKYSHIYLTRREAECLWFLSQGRTSKETARIMSLSSRTVESYITNLKVKTGTHWKNELVDIFLQSPIKNLFKNEMNITPDLSLSNQKED